MAARFENERQLLQQAIDGFVAGGIHHVGSTSVPGLDAKPIIDILAGVRNLEGARPCIGLVAPLGYLYARTVPTRCSGFASRTLAAALITSTWSLFFGSFPRRTAISGLPALPSPGPRRVRTPQAQPGRAVPLRQGRLHRVQNGFRAGHPPPCRHQGLTASTSWERQESAAARSMSA